MRQQDQRFKGPRIEYALHDAHPLGWRHPVTGRHQHREDPALERLGIYLRRSRYIAGWSQQRLANEIHIPQSQISRVERALAPSMDVERLAWMEEAFQGAFPLGYCPHDHVCQWRRLTAEQAWGAEVKRQQELTRLFYPPDSSDDGAADDWTAEDAMAEGTSSDDATGEDITEGGRMAEGRTADRGTETDLLSVLLDLE